MRQPAAWRASEELAARRMDRLAVPGELDEQHHAVDLEPAARLVGGAELDIGDDAVHPRGPGPGHRRAQSAAVFTRRAIAVLSSWMMDTWVVGSMSSRPARHPVAGILGEEVEPFLELLGVEQPRLLVQETAQSRRDRQASFHSAACDMASGSIMCRFQFW